MKITLNLTFAVYYICFAAISVAQEVKPRATLQWHEEAVLSLSFSSDGKVLASGSRYDSTKLWDVATGNNTATLKIEDGPPTGGSVALSGDGKTLASFENGSKILIWNVAAGKNTAQLEQFTDHSDPIVVFSPDGKVLASGGICMEDMRLWNVATGERIAALEGYDAYGVSAMTFGRDGKTMVSMGHDGVIKSWDTATGRNTSVSKTGAAVESATFSSDAKTVATSDRDSDEVKLWEVATGKGIATLKPRSEGIHSWQALAFSPNGKLLAAGGEDYSIQLWDVTTGKDLASFIGHEGWIHCLAFSPDGKTLASGSEDKTIKLWDVSKLLTPKP